MFKKILMIIRDFLKCSKTKEILDVYIIPLIFVLILLFFYKKFNSNIKSIGYFTKTFVDNVITVASLLAAFGVASITIILTSSSKNIEIAKEKIIPDRKDGDNISITYYKLLLVRSYYNIIIQFLLLFISIIVKFIICDKIIIFILSIELWLLLHSIFVQVFTIINLYFLMWENK
ncbi:MAG: hypothetical protein KatS3mg079_238 [Caloramator sp.]|nr:MAG: hypothetical protein KatS3mg079_238 [Caloramator sp.]